MKMQKTIRRFFNSEVMSREAARYVLEVLTCAVRRYGYATLVLSGGSTPRGLYTLLATAQYAHEIPWHSVHFFWGDERCVLSSDPCSNYKLALDTLLSRVPVPSGNIHRIQTELGWHESAVAYEDELRTFFGKRRTHADAEAELFDMVLLGMGKDGHTASLFPDSPALDEQVCWVAAVEAAMDICLRKRITLTLPILNRARHVLFLVAGKEKGEIVDTIVKEGDAVADRYPAARIRASEQVVFFYA